TARTKRRFFAFLLVVCLAVAGLTGWAAWQARSDALLRGFLAATNVAGVLEQHTARTVEAVDLSLSVAESRLRSEQFPHRHPSRIDQFLRERAAASPFIQRLVVTRPNGEVLSDSTGFPPGSPHFAPQADVEVPRPDGSMLAIGRPTLEPGGGPGTIAFSRRVGPLDAPDAVTVTAIVSLGHFRGF